MLSSEHNNPKRCAIAETLIVASYCPPSPLTGPTNGSDSTSQFYDVVSILKLYKDTHKSLKDTREISCPLTGKPFQLCPETMNSTNVKIEPLYGETSDHYTQLPPDYEIMSAVLRICGHEAFERYISSTDKDTLSVKDDRGNTLAHYAAVNGLTEILTALLDKDEELLKAANDRGLTPMHYFIASRSRRSGDPYELFSSRPLLLSLKDENGCTPVHYAAILGQTWLLKAQLYELFSQRIKSTESNTDCLDIKGRTPMHYVIAHARAEDLVFFYTFSKNSFHVTDNNGITPADVTWFTTSYWKYLWFLLENWSEPTKQSFITSVFLLSIFGLYFGFWTAQVLSPLMPCAKALALLVGAGVAATQFLGLMFCSASVFTILLTFYVARQDYAQQGIPQKNMWLYVFIALGSALGLIGAIIVASKFMPMIVCGIAGHTLVVKSLTPCIVQLVYFVIASAGILIGGLTSALTFLGIRAIADRDKHQAVTQLVEDTKTRKNQIYADCANTGDAARMISNLLLHQ